MASPLARTRASPSTLAKSLPPKMKHALSGLILLAIFFTLAMSAPFERGHGMLHRQSPHRGLSHRIQAAHGEQPPKLNLSFTPVISGEIFVHHVQHEASTQLQTSDFRFEATFSKLRRDDDVVDAGHPSVRDSQVALHSVDTYGGRLVVISARTYCLPSSLR